MAKAWFRSTVLAHAILAFGLAPTSAFTGAAPSVTEATQPYRGRRLHDVLRELQRLGLPVLFSSAVVSESLRVVTEPTETNPRELLDEILFAVDLRAVPGPGGIIQIIPASASTRSMSLRRHPAAYVAEIEVNSGARSVRGRNLSAQAGVSETTVPVISGDALRTIEFLPGVASTENSASHHVRGGTSADVAIVLDGLELYDPFHLRSFQSPHSVIDGYLARLVEVRSGGVTADRGDRHGGFIDIFTVSPESSGRGRGELELGTLNNRLAYSAPLPLKKGAFLMSARAWYPESLFHTTFIGGGEKLDPRFYDGYLKAGGSIGVHSLALHGLYAHDRLRLRETGESINESVDAVTRNVYAWIGVDSQWTESVNSASVVSGGRVDRRRDGVSAQTSPVEVTDVRVADFLGFKQDWIAGIGEDKVIKAGLDLRWISASYRYARHQPEDPTASVVTKLNPSGWSTALYLAYSVRFAPSITTEFGARLDRQSHPNGHQWSPRFNLQWMPEERTTLRVAWGLHSQSQRIHELAVEDGETQFQRAEVAEHGEISVSRKLGSDLYLSASGYLRDLSRPRRRFENLFEPIDLFSETKPDRILIAPDSVRMRGLELNLKRSQEGSFEWWVSYSLAAAEDVIAGRVAPRSWDQRHAVKGLVGYRGGAGWLFSLRASVHSGWPTTPVSATSVQLANGTTEIRTVIGERNSLRFSSYARVDAKVGREFPLRVGRLVAAIDIANLTNRKNECCVNEFQFATETDGSVVATPSLDYWLGITPSFSLRWEF